MPLFALLALALAAPPDWVPARWPSGDPKSLELLRNTPINCLLLEPAQWSREFVEAAAKAGIATLGVVRRQSDLPISAGMTGLVVEGDFVLKGAAVSLGRRSQIHFDAPATAIVGTTQGLWPGVHPEEKGIAPAAASGSIWIDTNAGFLRYAHAATAATVWIANTPPAGNIYPVERYLQAVNDAAINGARWVVALDDDLNSRLMARQDKAVRAWQRIVKELAFYESHPEWRQHQAYGKLALIESPATGALLSGGVLDMMAAKHTPVRPVPVEKATASLLSGVDMVVALDPAPKAFTGTLLALPKVPALLPNQLTLSKEDTEKLYLIWKDFNATAGRRNLGVRLFNVSTMLSNLCASPDGKQIVLHLVNYADYPVENVTVHLLGKYASALLYKPDNDKPIRLELYPTDEGVGLEIDQLATSAALVLAAN